MNKINLTANILFAGIGCQERGIINTELFNLSVQNIAEINKEAVLSYAAIHCGLTQEMIEAYADYPTREVMAEQLTKSNLGYDTEKNKVFNWYKLVNSERKIIEKYWLANKLAKNLGDIQRIDSLSYADLWTCSFCCQDVSLAGKMKGFSPDSGTRSSLLWENIRLLKQARDAEIAPKYILFENVKNLVSKRFMPDFKKLIDILNDLDYNTYWKVINSKDCGIPQNRERVFVICIRKDIDKGDFSFPKKFDKGIRLKDILDDVVDNKYYIKTYNDESIKKSEEKDKINKKISFDNIVLQESIKENKTDYHIRKLIPKECWRLMGLTDEDMLKAKEIGISDSQLYKQAGNGIVTNCIELLFEHLYKSQYDIDYKCTDENFGQLQSKLNVDYKENKPVLIGGVGEKNYGKQFRQGNRIYSSDNIAMACLSQPIGNTGGFSYLYLVDDTYKNRKPRLYQEYAPAIRAERQGFKVIVRSKKQ